MRRALRIAALLGALALILMITPFAAAFYGNSSLVAREAGAGIEVVVDGYTSVGLVELGGGKFLLVDAGNDPTGAPILAALKAHGAGADAVVAILLTHAHPDHVAACGLFPNATTYVGAGELPFLRGERSYRGPLPRLFAPQAASCARVEGVADAQTVPVGELKVTAWSITGHTAGSTAWLVNQTLFVGDAVTVKAPDRVVGPPWVFSDDLGEADTSLRSLAVRLPLTPELVVPAHTGAVSGDTFVGQLRGS